MAKKKGSIQLINRPLSFLQALNPVLLNGQPAFYNDGSGITKLVVGDGSSNFNSLNPAFGASILFSAANPIASAGNNGDIDIQTTAGQIYQKSSGAWALKYTFPAGGGSGTVTSVNSVLPISGNVALTTDNLPSGSTNKYYQQSVTDGLYVSLNGGTMAGLLILNADPSAPLGAATKQYVDQKALGSITYQGTYSAALNQPQLPAPATSNKGNYWLLTDSGTQYGYTFASGDWIVSDGLQYEKVNNSGPVNSIFGRIGPVVSQTGDYNTGQVTEAPSNLYFTNARVLGSQLGGFTVQNSVATGSDTVLTAAGKFQGQINALASATYAPISGSVNYIQNQTSAAQTGGFNVAGTSIIGAGSGAVGLTINGFLSVRGANYVVDLSSAGALSVPVVTTNPTTIISGYIVYNSSTNLFQFGQNGSWISLGSGGGGSVNTVNSVNPVSGNISLTADNIPESGAPVNQYFTNARVLSSTLTGLSVATGGVVTNANTMLQAIGQLQYQVSNFTVATPTLDQVLTAGKTSLQGATLGSIYINPASGLAGIFGQIAGTTQYQILGNSTGTFFDFASGQSLSFRNGPGGTQVAQLNSSGAFVSDQLFARTITSNIASGQYLYQGQVAGTAYSQWTGSPTGTNFDYSGQLNFRSGIAGQVRMIIDASGNLIVGNSTSVGGQTADPGTVTNGVVFYNSTTNQFKFGQAGVWVAIPAPGSGINNSTSLQTSANFNISGSGTTGVSIISPLHTGPGATSFTSAGSTAVTIQAGTGVAAGENLLIVAKNATLDASGNLTASGNLVVGSLSPSIYGKFGQKNNIYLQNVSGTFPGIATTASGSFLGFNLYYDGTNIRMRNGSGSGGGYAFGILTNNVNGNISFGSAYGTASGSVPNPTDDALATFVNLISMNANGGSVSISSLSTGLFSASVLTSQSSVFNGVNHNFVDTILPATTPQYNSGLVFQKAAPGSFYSSYGFFGSPNTDSTPSMYLTYGANLYLQKITNVANDPRVATTTATFDGSGNLTLASDLISVHLISRTAGAPTGAIQASAGTGASNAITGTDTAMNITITTGSAATANGVQSIISFNKTYAAAPKVVISPTTAAATNVSVYVTAVGTGGFSVAFKTAGAISTPYTFTAIVIQ